MNSNNNSRIEQIIEEIEEYIDSCKYQPLSSTKIIVNKEEIEVLLRELRMKTPDEIKRYQKIISNKEAILNDAKEKAQTIIADATIHTNELINEHEIMQQAYAQANEIVMKATKQAQDILDNATMDANNIRISAIQYTDDMLGGLETIIDQSMNNAVNKFNSYIGSLKQCYDIIEENRRELNPKEDAASAEDSGEAATSGSDDLELI